MKRWNGWGDDSRETTLPENGREFLIERLGRSRPARDAELKATLAQVPASRMPALPPECGSVSADPEERLRHARGQSFPDWLALRHGRAGPCPDAVAYPENTAQVEGRMHAAGAQGTHRVPSGGGTSVVGHLSGPAPERPVLPVDMARMDRLLELDRES